MWSADLYWRMYRILCMICTQSTDDYICTIELIDFLHYLHNYTLYIYLTAFYWSIAPRASLDFRFE